MDRVQLDATVLRASFLGVVARDRSRLAEALRPEPARRRRRGGPGSPRRLGRGARRGARCTRRCRAHRYGRRPRRRRRAPRAGCGPPRAGSRPRPDGCSTCRSRSCTPRSTIFCFTGGGGGGRWRRRRLLFARRIEGAVSEETADQRARDGADADRGRVVLGLPLGLARRRDDAAADAAADQRAGRARRRRVPAPQRRSQSKPPRCGRVPAQPFIAITRARAATPPSLRLLLLIRILLARLVVSKRRRSELRVLASVRIVKLTPALSRLRAAPHGAA